MKNINLLLIFIFCPILVSAQKKPKTKNSKKAEIKKLKKLKKQQLAEEAYKYKEQIAIYEIDLANAYHEKDSLKEVLMRLDKQHTTKADGNDGNSNSNVTKSNVASTATTPSPALRACQQNLVIKEKQLKALKTQTNNQLKYIEKLKNATNTTIPAATPTTDNTTYQRILAENTRLKNEAIELKKKLERQEATIKELLDKQSPPPKKITSADAKKAAKYKADVAKQRQVAQKVIAEKLPKSATGRLPVKISLFKSLFSAYVVDPQLNRNKIKIYWKDEQQEKYKSLGRLKTKLERNGGANLVFAMNGGMYMPNQDPQGLLVLDGEQKKAIDLKKDGYGNFYMQPNGVFLIDKAGKPHVVKSTDYHKYAAMAKYATQSGPALVTDGVFNPSFNQWSPNTNIRNGVGVTRDGKMVFIITKYPVNLFDFATMFRDVFDCPNALYLDGAISKMYCPELNYTKQRDLGGRFGPIIGILD